MCFFNLELLHTISFVFMDEINAVAVSVALWHGTVRLIVQNTRNLAG